MAVRSYVDVLHNYKFLDVINHSRFLKTIKAYDSSTGMLIVIKVFIKPLLVGIKLKSITELLGKESLVLAPYPNVLPWHRIIDTDLAGYLVRQLVRTNLYDRISLRPFLAPIEKLWLVFQLLRIVELLHSELHIRHGDIKTENLLVNSANWLVLADFSQHTKPVFLPDDNPSEFVFYFDSSDRRTCYLAPERFYGKGDKSMPPEDKDHWVMTDAMDLFSLGCVISELCKDGEPAFSLSDLYRYKRSELEPSFNGILEPDIRQMVKDLLARDPDTRPLAEMLLKSYRAKCFPEYFYTFLYDFVTEMNDPERFQVPENNDNVSPSDLRIDRIYESFSKIATALDFKYASATHSEYGPGFPALRLNLKGMPADYRIQPSSAFSDHAEQGALILLNLVSSLLNSLKRPSSKIKACELILALSERISDEFKLDRSLPFLCNMIDEYIEDASLYVGDHHVSDNENFMNNASFSTRVACVALVSITNLLASCSSINAINALVFPEYLAPKLKSIAFLNSPFKDETNHIRATLATCVPYLAKISERFCILSRKFHKADEETDNSFSIPKIRLDADFKDLTEALLADLNVNVRISLLNHILPLCQFFGVDKTNDLILTHLITYLNYPNNQLRLAFLTSIIEIGTFIGALAFEQYLLPLLFQTLGDHEPFVVLKVLEVFHFFLSEKLINPVSDFNVLSIYKELLSNSIILLLQPNEWIRQSVLSLLLVVSDNLLNADRFCFLYPLIKKYLSYDISILDWSTLYPCLTKPLSKQVYETALTWSSKATNKSLFWKQTKFSAINQTNGKRKLVSFSKDMGKSVYIPHSSSSSTLNGERTALDIPLSPEDRQWILKLKSVGMDDKDLWKVFALKDQFVGLNRSKLNVSSGDQTEFELASQVNVPPMNIFFEVCYKSEPITTTTKVTETSFEPLVNETSSIRSRKDSNSLLISSAGKARASLQTVEANVLGELELSHENASDRYHHHHHIHLTNRDSHVTHKVFSVNNQKIISATMRHNFTGFNPFILQYLLSIDFDPTLEDFPEFGSVIKSSRTEGVAQNSQMSIQGTLVAHVNANTTASSLEEITKVVVCPTSEFFVTGSEFGNLKVWDSSKLDKNITGKSASISVNLKHSISDIVFMQHRFVFAVTTADGHIRLFKVHVSRGKNRKITKYSKLVMIRCVKLDEGYAGTVQFVSTSAKTLCVVVTSTCKMIAYDIIRMEKEFEFQNPLHYGVPTTFVVSKNCTWCLLGTSDGTLCLWDARFQILLKAWRVTIDRMSNTKTEIRQLMVIPSPSHPEPKKTGSVYIAMIGGNTEPDITVWEIPSFECRQVYTANETSPRIKPYALQELEINKEMSVENIFADFSIDLDQDDNRSNTALTHVQRGGVNPHTDGYFVTATEDNRVIVWDLQDFSKSVLLLTEKEVNFTKNQISQSLTVAYEKVVPGASAAKKNISKFQHDAITGLAVISKPYYMVVAVERNGTINVYK